MTNQNNAAQAADPNFVVTELSGIIGVAGDSPTVIVSVERMRLWLSNLRATVADEQFKAAFPNGVLPVEKYHELWERAGEKRNPNYTLLENLTWQVGMFGDLVAKEASAPVAGEARPTDDALWDQTLTERDEYHDMADKLADAIADHLLVEIGEHSSRNCPWMRALDAIQNAAPQATKKPHEVAGSEAAPKTLVGERAQLEEERVRLRQMHAQFEGLVGVGTARREGGSTFTSLNHVLPTLPNGHYALYAAPQASEAQCSCPSGDGSLRHPCSEHPAQGADGGALDG